MANPGDDNYLSTRDGMQVLRAAFDDNSKRIRTDAEFTGTLEVNLDSTDDSVSIGDPAGINFLVINPEGSSTVRVTDGTDTLAINPDGSINTVIDGEVSIEISAADGDNIAIANQSGTQFMAVNADGSINITDNGGSITVDQGTSPWVVGDGGGSLTVDGPLTDTQLRATPVPVSGTLAVTQSTSPWVVSGTVTANLGTIDGAATEATLATRLADATFTSRINTLGQKTAANSTPVVLASDQSAIPITDNGGSITVDGTVAVSSVAGTVAVTQSTSPWVENVSQFGGSAVVTGTGTSGAGIPRVTVSNDSNILATQSGSWTVTANAGTNLNTSALALDTSVTGLQVSQGSTTSGEKGPLVQGAVTTAAPTYTTGQTNPLSLTTSGALRVDNSANTQPVSGTVNAKAATPTAGTVTQAAITVGTSAVRATVSGAAPSATRSVLLVSPDSASTAKFYMGSSSVTNSGANRGFQLLGGDQVAFSSDAGDYYIISDTAGQTVYITEQA